MAKLRRELIAPKGGGGVAGEGFDVAKTGGMTLRLFAVDYYVLIMLQVMLTVRRRSDWIRR